MKLKTAMIDEVLNEFLEPFEATVEMGTDFSYWYSESKIEYTLVMPEKGKDYFMENWHNLAPDIEIDPFLASFTHELGHHLTLDELEDYEECYCKDTKAELDLELQNKNLSEERIKEIHFKYYSLPDEYEATAWAIRYIREHTEEIARFWKKLQAAIMEFYKVNNIDVTA